jgi:ribulose-5-phosphate 4-epimerase/fuculose-1-phosphate aldolase
MNVVAPEKKRTMAEPDERQLRQHVAACTLLLNDLGLLGYSGHVAARLPGRDAIIIQSRDQPRSRLGPDDLLICDFDGKVVDGPAGVKPPSEIFLHTEIMRARADVNAVAHFHHDRTTVFTMVENAALKLIKNHAIRWANGIPVHPEPGHVNSPSRGRALAATLGAAHALLIRAHGQVVAAESVPAVLVDCATFVENAEAMILASQLGRVLPLTKDEIADFAASLDRNHFVSKAWTYYVTLGRTRGVLPADWPL